MTAFDGYHTEVGVFFDSDGPEIELSFTDVPTYQPQEDDHEWSLTIHRDEVPNIVEDLVIAYWLRGGDPIALLTSARDRFTHKTKEYN